MTVLSAVKNALKETIKETKEKVKKVKGKCSERKSEETGHCFEVREVHSLVSRIPNAFRPLELRARKGKGGWEQGCEA